VDQAVQRTAEVLYIAYPDLCAELIHLGRLQRMGQTRVQAWKQLVVRTKSPDIEQIANMLSQADTFGTPISDALRVLEPVIKMWETSHPWLFEYVASKTIDIHFPPFSIKRWIGFGEAKCDTRI
jgi:hypothetical protein